MHTYICTHTYRYRHVANIEAIRAQFLEDIVPFKSMYIQVYTYT